MESSEAGCYPSISLRIISHSYSAAAQRHGLLGQSERCAQWALIFVANGTEERLGQPADSLHPPSKSEREAWMPFGVV